MRIATATLVGALRACSPRPRAPYCSSSNVTLVNKLPEAVGAIGARFSPDGKLMYVTTAKGLHIYDVRAAAAPQRVGVLPLPHFENEDVDVGRNTVVISNDPSFSGVGAIYLIDVADPSQAAAAQDAGHQRARRRRRDRRRQHRERPHRQLHQGLQLPLHDRHGRGPGDLRHPRPRQPALREDVQDAGPQGRYGARVHARRGRRQVRDRVGERPRRDVRLQHERSREPAARLPHGRERGQHRRRAARRRRQRPAGLPAPQREAGLVRAAGDHGGGLREADVRGPGLGPDVEDHERAQLRRLAQARCSRTCGRPSSTSWRRSRAARRPPATARRTGSTRTAGCSPRAGTTRACASSTCRRRSSIRQVGFYASAGTFWAAYFAPSDPTGQTVYGLDTAGGIDVLHIDRSQAPGAMRTRARRNAARISPRVRRRCGPAPRVGLRLPAGRPDRDLMRLRRKFPELGSFEPSCPARWRGEVLSAATLSPSGSRPAGHMGPPCRPTLVSLLRSADAPASSGSQTAISWNARSASAPASFLMVTNGPRGCRAVGGGGDRAAGAADARLALRREEGAGRDVAARSRRCRSRGRSCSRSRRRSSWRSCRRR